MVCSEAAVHAYFDDELEPDQRAAVAGHLKSCVECRSTLKELRWLHTALSEPPGRIRSWRRWLALAAVLALALLSWRAWTRPPAPAPHGALYQVSLAGSPHQVKVEGAELVELASGLDSPDQNVDLRKAKIE